MSLSGMTGFGRREGDLAGWSWAVEARSVNGRNLEVRYRGPPGFDTLEKLSREAAQVRFARGQVNVNVAARRAESSAAVRINVQVLDAYLAVGAPLITQGRVAIPTLDGLLALRGVIESGDDLDDPEIHSQVQAAMAQSVILALDDLKQARDEEGVALQRLLVGFLDKIEAATRSAEGQAAKQPAVIHQRFALRLAELAGEATSEERVIQEAAAMAMKVDVREELDRLHSHLTAGRALLAEDAAAGRRLDFLTQEFMREANTLCSKAATTELTRLGLELKATIDQFREQVQNVE